MSPIVGMTRREDVTPKFPDLGKLRKGGPKTDPKKPGPDLEYWRFTSERPEVQAAFAASHPNNPKVVEAYLPFAAMEENWLTWFEEWDAGGMVHRCDGRTMYRWRNGNGEYVDGERPCPYAKGEKTRTAANPGCKQVGRLNLILPALIKAGHVGFVVMETHSINDLVSITQCLLDIERKAGKLTGILLAVMRVKQTISTPAWKEEDKKAGRRNRTVKDLVKIVPASEWVLAQLDAQHNEAMLQARGGVPQLMAGNGVSELADEDDDYEPDDEDVVETEATEVTGTPPAEAQPEPEQPSSDKLFEDMEAADPPITKEQYDELGALVDKLYPTPQAKANFRDWMKDQYGVAKGFDLSAKQATALTAELKAALERAGKA